MLPNCQFQNLLRWKTSKDGRVVSGSDARFCDSTDGQTLIHSYWSLPEYPFNFGGWSILWWTATGPCQNPFATLEQQYLRLFGLHQPSFPQSRVRSKKGPLRRYRYRRQLSLRCGLELQQRPHSSQRFIHLQHRCHNAPLVRNHCWSFDPSHRMSTYRLVTLHALSSSSSRPYRM
jgi:hypothetical protein